MRRIGLITAMCAALLLIGCANQGSTANTETKTEEQSQNENQEETILVPEDDSVSGIDYTESRLYSCLKLLGKTEENDTDIFSNGTEILSEDGTKLLGKSYLLKLFGEEETMETTYGAKGKVELVKITFGGTDAESYMEQLSVFFGEGDVSRTKTPEELEAEEIAAEEAAMAAAEAEKEAAGKKKTTGKEAVEKEPEEEVIQEEPELDMEADNWQCQWEVDGRTLILYRTSELVTLEITP